MKYFALFLVSLIAVFASPPRTDAQSAAPSAAPSVAPSTSPSPVASPASVKPPNSEVPPAPAKPTPAASPTPTPGPPFGNMQWREIGPAAGGGRVAAVAGSAANPKLYYVGSAGGGVWKSENSGQTWDPVFDKQPVAAIGAVTIDPTDDKTVWVGTGESNPRNDVSYGDGIYKTTNGGDDWTNAGLRGTKYISRIVVTPAITITSSSLRWATHFPTAPSAASTLPTTAAQPGGERCTAVPRAAHRTLRWIHKIPAFYMRAYGVRRQPWTFQSGGDDDGLYKSTDGGSTWAKLVGNGLPANPVGRIGLAIAPSNPNRVYALIESSKGILWRSDDGGANWTMVSNDTLVDQRPFYFTHIAVDPKNPDHVYGVSEALSESTDGGKTFKAIADTVHVDYHAIWIAPNDPSRIIVGEDGGYALTLDDGANWFFSANLPIAQVYRVGLGNDNPYTVCAGLQDNNGWCGPSNSLDSSGIQNKEWIVTVGGDGEWGIPEPDDANWIWSDSENGSLIVFNRVTQDGWSAAPVSCRIPKNRSSADQQISL